MIKNKKIYILICAAVVAALVIGIAIYAVLTRELVSEKNQKKMNENSANITGEYLKERGYSIDAQTPLRETYVKVIEKNGMTVNVRVTVWDEDAAKAFVYNTDITSDEGTSEDGKALITNKYSVYFKNPRVTMELSAEKSGGKFNNTDESTIRKAIKELFDL